MVYDYKKKGVYSVPAQQAGEELQRIYTERGRMEASDIVDESRPESAVLHPVFEWDDPKAAELYRQEQARGLCRCLIVVSETEEPEVQQIEIRAFQHVSESYRPIHVIINDDDMYEELVETALKEFQSCAKKHAILSKRPELQGIFEAIDSASKRPLQG